MTDNLKKFLEKRIVWQKLVAQIQNMNSEELIRFAEKLGFALSSKDLEEAGQAGALLDDALTSATWGDNCGCVIAGCGQPGIGDTGLQKCVCMIGGYGLFGDNCKRCDCYMGGGGDDHWSTHELARSRRLAMMACAAWMPDACRRAKLMRGQSAGWEAAKHNITLTNADVSSATQEGSISDDELCAVAGGGKCGCYTGGGGTNEGVNLNRCGCVVFGTGTSSDGESRCTCISVGGGVNQ